MYREKKINALERYKRHVTGGHHVEDLKEITYPFDKYEIKISLSKDNKFRGITAVKINKDFLSYKQKNVHKGFHDVEKFYPE